MSIASLVSSHAGPSAKQLFSTLLREADGTFDDLTRIVRNAAWADDAEYMLRRVHDTAGRAEHAARRLSQHVHANAEQIPYPTRTHAAGLVGDLEGVRYLTAPGRGSGALADVLDSVRRPMAQARVSVDILRSIEHQLMRP
jgi:hypothetical protein